MTSQRSAGTKPVPKARGAGKSPKPQATSQGWIKPYPLGDQPTAQQWEDREDRNQPWAKTT